MNSNLMALSVGELLEEHKRASHEEKLIIQKIIAMKNGGNNIVGETSYNNLDKFSREIQNDQINNKLWDRMNINLNQREIKPTNYFDRNDMGGVESLETGYMNMNNKEKLFGKTLGARRDF